MNFVHQFGKLFVHLFIFVHSLANYLTKGFSIFFYQPHCVVTDHTKLLGDYRRYMKSNELHHTKTGLIIIVIVLPRAVSKQR